MKSKLAIFKNGIAPFLLIIFCSCSRETKLVTRSEVWVTKSDQTKLFEKLEVSNFDKTPDLIIKVNPDEKFQEMEGFGFALTEGSAEALIALDSGIRNQLLKEFYDKNQSVVRISIGASDLSNSVYTYNEYTGDEEMSKFSLSGPDEQYMFPILKEILEINPDLKIMATPWSAPTWMKTNGAWIGGKLKKEAYPSYAKYFSTYIEKMKEQGFDIWAITPQNEPLNPKNEPSMVMEAREQLEFVQNYLGPLFESKGIKTKIIAYDHNCDRPDFPITVLNGTKYADGAAFHLYGGDISTMGIVHDSTGKDVYFTEQFVSSKGNFGGDLEWHVKNVLIGSSRNWSKTVIEWNLATNSDFGPRTPGGCTECLGAVTINGANEFEKNVSFYIIQHLSKFVKPGAFRIGSTASTLLPNVAFMNSDGSLVLLAFNAENKDLLIDLNNGEISKKVNIPAKSAATIVF